MTLLQYFVGLVAVSYHLTTLAMDPDSGRLPKKEFQAKSLPQMDVVMGVQFLHQMGLTGKDITVGVIDLSSSGEEVQGKRRGFKGTVHEDSDPFSFEQSCHSSFVTGVICSPKIKGRLAVAPDSKILFKGFPASELLSASAYKCEITPLEDWIFKEGTVPKGSKVTIYQPNLRYIRVKPQKNPEPESNYIRYIYKGNEMSPNLTDEQISLRHPNVYGCVGLYGDQRSSYSKDLYPGLVVYIEPTGSEVDDRLSDIINAMHKRGIRIINFSVTSPFGPKTLKALRDLAADGGVFVVAAGNEGKAFSLEGYDNSKPLISTVLITNYLSTIAKDLPQSMLLVGNLKKENKEGRSQLHESSVRAGVLKENFISAWGEDIPSIKYERPRPWEQSSKGIKRHTEEMTGTSYAAPMVAGVIADLHQGFPHCNPLQIKNVLLKTASKKGLEGTPDDYGQGRLDAEAAYNYLKTRGCPK